MSEQKNYYAIIPANVRYDKTITANAKLLYGEITALCNEKGFCWASNNYFAELYSVKPQAISKWIKSLESAGYLDIEYTRKGKEITQRKVSISVDRYQQKDNRVSIKKEEGINKNVIGYQQKRKDNNTYNNITNNTINTSPHFQIAVEFYNHYSKKKARLLVPSEKDNLTAKAIYDRLPDIEYVKKLIPIFFDDSNEFWFNKDKAYYFNSFATHIQTLISAEEGTYEKPTNKKQDGENQAAKLAFIKSITEGCDNG